MYVYCKLTVYASGRAWMLIWSATFVLKIKRPTLKAPAWAAPLDLQKRKSMRRLNESIEI